MSDTSLLRCLVTSGGVAVTLRSPGPNSAFWRDCWAGHLGHLGHLKKLYCKRWPLSLCRTPSNSPLLYGLIQNQVPKVVKVTRPIASIAYAGRLGKTHGAQSDHRRGWSTRPPLAAPRAYFALGTKNEAP